MSASKELTSFVSQPIAPYLMADVHRSIPADSHEKVVKVIEGLFYSILNGIYFTQLQLHNSADILRRYQGIFYIIYISTSCTNLDGCLSIDLLLDALQHAELKETR